ncbi:nucleotidyltransferase domain-containing protein [Terrimonas sp. NA20]|uniref:Nucleotidyltransferase domain-containing protein n=1 Tax=Terrimonas ginsenosidimutans TaxID=2908004 RepID=A0ABS9KNU8_9BACT|nr:nucleotidyltransferase domain-containing protein [Terrimonas ginsenosidimutans]MCG2613959.1 nucleotidyltransferase domain-containing protein [Terrimonas ginsenosidimutans]
MQLTVDDIKKNGWLIFEAIAGSRSYGLDTAGSDTDIRGVFVLPKALFYSLEYTPQVSNETNDIVYFELGRFIELLAKSNPNILELLGIDERFVLQRHAVMDRIDVQAVLSRQCEQTFANYAYTQIRKAHGLEKKILNPMDGERRSVLDFCYVYIDGKTVPVKDFLFLKGWKQEDLGLTSVPHLRDGFNLYHSADHVYQGIVRKEESNEVCVSNIPAGESPVALLSFNRDGYSVHCKKLNEYQEWLLKRNEGRYANTLQHGRKYDAKNMMHVFRLLLMAKEIAEERKINVLRPDREFLLSVKSGEFEYEELIAKAEGLKARLAGLYQRSGLPDMPDRDGLNKLLVELREYFYHGQLI